MINDDIDRVWGVGDLVTHFASSTVGQVVAVNGDHVTVVVPHAVCQRPA